MLNILLLGNTGQLGWELERALQQLGQLWAMDHPRIDMTDPGSIRRIVQECRPGLIVNATAYTDVDRAENELAQAQAVNAVGPGVLAEAAREMKAVLIHYSTDYVFDGCKGSPYLETDPAAPLNVYGRSKLEGEHAIQSVGCVHLILRTAWVYSLRRSSFVTKVLGWARTRENLRVVNDQVSNPTWARALAGVTARLVAKADGDLLSWLGANQGIYHLAGAGYTSRYDWAQAILALDPRQEGQKVVQLSPARSADFPTPAERPLFSALDCRKFEAVFGLQLPSWQAALRMAMQEYEGEN